MANRSAVAVTACPASKRRTSRWRSIIISRSDWAKRAKSARRSCADDSRGNHSRDCGRSISLAVSRDVAVRPQLGCNVAQ
jgi:hypothetical protein